MVSIDINKDLENKSVLVLGCTGFVGKCLIEKLMRSVPTLQNIYCVIRSPDLETAQKRLNEMLLDSIFTSTPNIPIDAVAKPCRKPHLVVMAGDLLEGPDIGLSESDLQQIRDKVSCVFNLAGSSKLDDSLRTCLEENVCTLLNVLKFSQTLPHLRCLLCMSSIYTNCDRATHIDEVIYSNADINVRKMIRALRWMTDDMFEAAKPHLMKSKFNTFVFCKYLSECLIHEVSKTVKIPVVLIRASMIGATYREPFSGWIDEKGTVQPSDFFIATARGYLRTTLGHQGYFDIIPVDVLVGILIASTVYTASCDLKETTIYHCSSDGALKTPDCANLINRVSSYSVPFEKAFRRPNLSVTESSWMHSIAIVYSHLLPALVGDAARVLLLKKPYFLGMYRGIHKNVNLVEYFTAKKLTLSNQNLLSLYFSLSPEDVHQFFLDPASINWPEYIEQFLKGTKLFLLKEQDCYIKDARNHLRTLRNVRWTFNFLLLAFLWRFFIAKSQFAVNLWSVVLSFVYRFLTFMPLTAARSV